MIGVVPHVEAPPDHVGDSLGAPCLVREAMEECTLPQEGAELFQLQRGQSGGASGGNGGLETACTFESLFPVAHGMHGDAEVLSDLLL